MKWPKTPLTELLGIRYPIIQAPMAEDVTTPELVAAVANAGGLGSLGAGAMEPEAIRTAIRRIRTLTDKPFAVNLFIPEPVSEDAERIIRANEILNPYRTALNLPEPDPLAAYTPDYTEQLGVLFEEKVNLLSFTYGLPRPSELESVKQQGIITIGTATHLVEALVLEESGIDVIVAQGAEAGGHRGTFIGSFRQGMIGTIVLLPLLADHISVPLVAAGGIMDSRGICAALTLGADGVQMGTAFLSTQESGAHPQYKELLFNSNEVGTTVTKVFSGKPGRSLRNQFIRELQQVQSYLPGYPTQNAITRPIRQAAVEQDMLELMPLWAGQGSWLCQQQGAADLIASWVEEVERLLAG